MQVTLSKRTTFSASHFYWLDNLSEAENEQLFGLCSNRYGHGHNYTVIVSVTGTVDPQTGMVMNLKDLKTVMQQVINEPLEHKHLNHQVDYFKASMNGKVPTLENIAIYIWQGLQNALKAHPCELTGLKVIENERLYVEFFGHFAERPEVAAA